MPVFLTRWGEMMRRLMISRRQFALLAIAGGFVGAASAKELLRMPEMVQQKPPEDRFPGDPPQHKAVYMLNSPDPDVQRSVLNSLQAMIKAYGDNVALAVVVIGPAIHLLAKTPQRPVEAATYARVESFAKDYRVRFIACGNTMETIGLQDSDMRPFAEYALVGAAALMRLQEEGYKAIYW